MVYLVSDVHGCYYTFQSMLKKIKLSQDDILICLGDVIDRGRHSFKILDMFMQNPDFILIKGNHEYFYDCFMNQRLSVNSWYSFGGNFTIQDLKSMPSEQKLAYYNFLHKLPLYYETEEYILSHSGFHAELPFVKDENGNILVKETITKQWETKPYNFIVSGDIHYMPRFSMDKKLIVGHHPTETRAISYEVNCINIDCGATYKNGRLGCLCLDTMEEFYMSVNKKDI